MASKKTMLTHLLWERLWNLELLCHLCYCLPRHASSRSCSIRAERFMGMNWLLRRPAHGVKGRRGNLLLSGTCGHSQALYIYRGLTSLSPSTVLLNPRFAMSFHSRNFAGPTSCVLLEDVVFMVDVYGILMKARNWGNMKDISQIISINNWWPHKYKYSRNNSSLAWEMGLFVAV